MKHNQSQVWYPRIIIELASMAVKKMLAKICPVRLWSARIRPIAESSGRVDVEAWPSEYPDTFPI